jgi:hypothetical protein
MRNANITWRQTKSLFTVASVRPQISQERKHIHDKLSSGYFPGVCVLKADVSELCVGSIFNTSPPVENGTDTEFRNVGF